MARPPQASKLEDVVGAGGSPPAHGSPGPPLDRGGTTGGAPAPAAAPPPSLVLPALPDVKVRSGHRVEHKTVVIFGPVGIGKSTMASEWAGGNVFFWDVSGELNDLEVYKSADPPIRDWDGFRLWCASIVKDHDKYEAGVIDTCSTLDDMVSAFTNKKLGIAHESDADWGKGWKEVRKEFSLALAKLAAIPHFGIVMIFQAQDIEIKERSRAYHRMVPAASKGVREPAVEIADLVIYCDWKETEDGISRVMRTKPSIYWEAKERGQNPRLPEEIEWPLGTSGWDILKAYYEE